MLQNLQFSSTAIFAINYGKELSQRQDDGLRHHCIEYLYLEDDKGLVVTTDVLPI